MTRFVLIALILVFNSCQRTSGPTSSLLQAYRQYNVLLRVKSRLRERELDREEKVKLLSFAEELAPKDPEIKLLKAKMLKEEGYDNLAKKFLEEALRLSPTYTPALLAYGEMLIASGDTEGGKNYCLFAVKLNPIDAAARFCAGKTLPQLQR